MIKLSRLSCYSVVILSDMVADGRNSFTAADIAEITRLPEPTVSKILKVLAKNEFVSSVRGASGGYSLNCEPEKITVLDVVEAVDGRVAITGCADGNEEDCRLRGNCSITGKWDSVNSEIRKALRKVSILSMAKDNSSTICKSISG